MKISKLLALLFAIILVASGLTGQRTQAAPINGAITFAGGAQFDTMTLATATRVDLFVNVAVVSIEGDYSGFVSPNDSATMATPWIFSPSTLTAGLWEVGGFTFDLDSSTIVLQTSRFLLIEGTGSIMGNGFDATPGTFAFSTQAPDGRGIFSFSASSAALPDHGATVALLGIGLVVVELVRRRLAPRRTSVFHR